MLVARAPAPPAVEHLDIVVVGGGPVGARVRIALGAPAASPAHDAKEVDVLRPLLEAIVLAGRRDLVAKECVAQTEPLEAPCGGVDDVAPRIVVVRRPRPPRSRPGRAPTRLGLSRCAAAIGVDRPIYDERRAPTAGRRRRRVAVAAFEIILDEAA